MQQESMLQAMTFQVLRSLLINREKEMYETTCLRSIKCYCIHNIFVL
jgi:hypothetical protein